MGAVLFYAEGTGRYDEADSSFSHFCERN